MRTFQSLNEQEILALAISLEEEDARIYADFAAGLKENYPATADTLNEIARRRTDTGIGCLRSISKNSANIFRSSGATM
jgi:hypothetical protein